LARAPVCQGHVAFFIGPKGCVASNEIVESHVVTKPQPMRFEHASRGAVPENAPVPEGCHLPARTSSPGGYVSLCGGLKCPEQILGRRRASKALAALSKRQATE
jgi:hypothetical protein